MKKLLLIASTTVLFIACKGDLKVNEEKLNDAGEKLQKTVQKGVDSVGSKLKRLKNKLDKDSTE